MSKVDADRARIAVAQFKELEDHPGRGHPQLGELELLPVDAHVEDVARTQIGAASNVQRFLVPGNLNHGNQIAPPAISIRSIAKSICDQIQYLETLIHANQTDVQKILGGVQQYVVPPFQRSFGWENRQWTKLWATSPNCARRLNRGITSSVQS